MMALPIDKLVAWAFGEELPRAQALAAEGRGSAGPKASSTWDAIEWLARLGTVVDRSPGRLPSIAAETLPPHADAYLVEDAVGELALALLDMPAGFDALGEIQGLTPEERARAHALGWDIACAKGERLAALVVRRAMTGTTPGWANHGQIRRRPVMGAKGRPRWFRMLDGVEVDGYDGKRHRPHAGAYRRTWLDPDPSFLVAERIEYQAWALALRFLAVRLHGRMQSHGVLPGLPILWPWLPEGARGVRLRLAPAFSTRAQTEPAVPA